MLLNQAVPAFEAWFGIKPVIDAALRQKILSTF
jgi:shikimate 5-dehydrogenase